jgi:nitroimidazol reductase NimA-like FMN-containing flavoprotein (pyridoxamine 5'-phosphate oxidase superfamily)
MTQRELEELSTQECLDLLASRRVGRFVYVDEQGPVAIPVNYAMAGADIVFRVEQGTKRAALEQPAVAFGVDHIDEAARSAWSVIVRGAAYEVDMDHVPDLLRRMSGQPPAPWAFGIHNVWLRLVASGMTGRRLGAPGSPRVF